MSVAADRLVYKTALSLVTIATSGLVRLVFSLLIGRVFDQPVLGHANVLVSAAVFATLLCSPGLGQSVARQMATRGLAASDPAGRALLVRATLLHHAVCAVVAVGVGVFAPTKLGLETLLAILLTFAYGCYTYYKAVLYGVDYVRRYAALELIWDGLFLVALVTVVALGARHWLLAPMVLVYGGFSAGAHRALLPRRRGAAPPPDSAPPAAPPPRADETDDAEARRARIGDGRAADAAASDPATPGAGAGVVAEPVTVQHVDDRPWWRAVGGYALVTTFGTASSAGFLQLSVIFALRAGGEHGAGLFAAALSLVTPAYLLPRAISVVLFPAMARAAGRFDAARVRLHLKVGTQVLAAALLPVFALAAILAPSVLTLAYGRDFADGATTLVVMVWATWVSVASVPAVNALSSDTGRGYVIPAVASVAGFLVGLGWWIAGGTSIESVAWGYLAGSVVQSAVPMIRAARRYGVPGIGFGARVLAAAGAALAVSLLCGPLGIGVRIAIAIAVSAAAAIVVLPELRGLRRVIAERALA